MTLLVRKIERAKWEQNNISNGDDVSADAITVCMKTKNNAISVWEVPDETKVQDAILAMVSGFDHLDTIDVVMFSYQDLVDSGLIIESNLGKTPISTLAQTHRDISRLTYSALGILAKFTVEQFKNDKVRRFTKGQLSQLLQDSIERGLLNKDLLNENVKAKLK